MTKATEKTNRSPANLLETAALLQTQCQQIEEEREGTIHNLREREKQTKFLYQFLTLACISDLQPEDFIREFLDLIPTLWQYPDETSARVFIDGQEFRTTNYIVESNWKFSTEIAIDSHPIGSLEIFYVEGYPDDYQGILIWREPDFLRTIAQVISFVMQNSQLGRKYNDINRQYENVVQSHQELENRIGGFVPKLKLMNEKFQKTIEAKNRFIKQIGQEILHQIKKTKSGFEDNPKMVQPSESADPLLDRLICLGKKVEQYVDYEAGNFTPENKPFSIRSMLAEVLKDVGPKALANKVNILPMVNPLIPDRVSGDGAKLTEIIHYLVDYSLEVGLGGQVIIKVELEASAHLLPIYSFSIILTGCHDSETELSRILSLKSGMSVTDENDYMISRLGVVISRQLVELMGGEIWIEGGSDIGGKGHPGISFQFTTWLDIDKEHDQRTFCLDLPNTSSYQILVVDQNRDMCQMLEEYFATLGFAITIAADWQKACELLEESIDKNSEWVLAIVDGQIVNDSGQNLLELANEKGWLNKTPIILTGPESCRDLAQGSGNLELIRFAPKPFDFWHFDLLVRQILDKIKPVVSVSESDPEPDEQESECEIRPDLKTAENQKSGPERIGVVSPDKVTRTLLTKILEKQDYKMTAFATVAEIEETITTGQLDALLIDLHPNLADPDKFVQKIRLAENFSRRHIPIVMILSPESDNAGEETIEAGADQIINIGNGYGPLCDQIRSLLDQFGPQNRSSCSEAIESFDRQTALKLANDDLDLLLELLEVFDEEADDNLSQMKLAVQMQNRDDLSQAARALEHSAAKMGAVEVKRLSSKIIEAVERDGLSNIGKPLQELQGSLEEFAHEVARFEKSVAM